MSPRPSTAHLRRPAILTAAAEVISERGIHNTRISDVAERAGTSAPGVLYWFPSKDELLAETLKFADDRFYEGLTEELEALGSASARLTRLIELWPAADDGETVLWMELWVRALRDPHAGGRRASGWTAAGARRSPRSSGKVRRPGSSWRATPRVSRSYWERYGRVRDPARAGRSRRIDRCRHGGTACGWR